MKTIILPESFHDFSLIQDLIVIKLIGEHHPIDTRHKVPSLKYLDLRIIFTLMLRQEDNEVIYAPVTDELMNEWKQTPKDLYPIALQNTVRLSPPYFDTLASVLPDDDVPQDSSDNPSLFILTNTRKAFGAAAVLYPGMGSDIYRAFREDYYVLPCSIHELIVMPVEEGIPASQLREMVTSINATHVEEEDFLSNTVYRYDHSRDRLVIA